MTPGAVLARVAELAVDHGADVVRAVTAIVDTIRGEHPELNLAPLPDEGGAMMDARGRAEEAIRRAVAAGDMPGTGKPLP